MNRQGIIEAVGRLAILLTALQVASANAQQSRPAPTSLPTVPFADYTFGFEMRIPAGWSYDRTRFAGPGGAVGLLRGGAVDARATLQILVFRKPETVSFADWVRYYEEQLTRISGTLKIAGKERQIGERKAAILEVDARLGADYTKTYYLCIPFDPTKTWVFSYAVVVTPTGDPGPARQHFEQLVESVRVLYDMAQAREMTAAFQRGQTLVARISAESVNMRLPEEERCYDVVVKGKSIGFLTRRVTRESRSLDDPRYHKQGKPGLRVHEQSWHFAADGSARHSQVDLFSSFDLRTELIETRCTQVPASDAVGQRPFITLDQCLREGDLLFSSYSTNLDIDLPDPREPIQIGDTYLSLAWVRLLPAVLGDKPGPTHAFAVYDAKTRAMSTSTVRPLGPRPLPGQAKARAHAFETSEGFAKQPALVYTDASGLLLRYEAGDLVLRLTSKEAVERRWGSRRDAAQERVKGQGR
jgi:hypothetical protein